MSAGVWMIAIIFCSIVLLMLLASYNALTQLRSDVRSAWSRMDEQLKQRYQLVPQLVQHLQSRGDIAAEKSSAVSTARNAAAVALNPQQLADAESKLGIAIRAACKTQDVPESLRQQFMSNDRALMQSVRVYNDTVRSLNESICTFPTHYAAQLLRLRFQPFFELRTQKK